MCAAVCLRWERGAAAYVLAYICVCVCVDERKHLLLVLQDFFSSCFSSPLFLDWWQWVEVRGQQYQCNTIHHTCQTARPAAGDKRQKLAFHPPPLSVCLSLYLSIYFRHSSTFDKWLQKPRNFPPVCMKTWRYWPLSIYWALCHTADWSGWLRAVLLW